MCSDSLGARIALIRGKMTQAEFSEKLGISRKTLIRYEKNESDPSASFLQALISDFGVDPRWLLIGDEPPKGFNSRESILVSHFRNCDDRGKDALLAAGAAMAKPGRGVKKAG
jgi:transcriptional regulator with XRE-family HTH domain